MPPVEVTLSSLNISLHCFAEKEKVSKTEEKEKRSEQLQAKKDEKCTKKNKKYKKSLRLAIQPVHKTEEYNEHKNKHLY